MVRGLSVYQAHNGCTGLPRDWHSGTCNTWNALWLFSRAQNSNHSLCRVLPHINFVSNIQDAHVVGMEWIHMTPPGAHVPLMEL